MKTISSTQPERLRLAKLSLEGLCVGDCFGQRFFIPGAIVGGIVALAVGRKGIPSDWRDAAEPLPLFQTEAK